jgi:lipid-binding SYLF domain-containing protein
MLRSITLVAFKDDDTFSLNADAKLTLADYSALKGQTTIGEGKDVIFWSSTEGAFAGIALSATDISWDKEENPAYFGKPVQIADVLDGTVSGKQTELD